MLTAGGDLYTLGCGEQGQLGRVPELFANRGGRQGLGKWPWYLQQGKLAGHPHSGGQRQEGFAVVRLASDGLVVLVKTLETDCSGSFATYCLWDSEHSFFIIKSTYL